MCNISTMRASFHKQRPTILAFFCGMLVSYMFFSTKEKEGYNEIKEFSAKKIRSAKDIVYKRDSSDTFIRGDDEVFCALWAVITTSLHPSEAVKKIAKGGQWCMVIIAGKAALPKSRYLSELGSYTKSDVVYLSHQAQKYMFPLLEKTLPSNHLGRKNIGYMYAIKHGANFIWDFDDDNVNVVPTEAIETMDTYRIPCVEYFSTAFNPYPYFQVNETYSWPRGFPLEQVRSEFTLPRLCLATKKRRVGVVQSLANMEPDVDAIYKLTKTTPVRFGATPSGHLPIMVSSKSFSPFNAQATLWMPEAFLYLALPVSLNDHVTDIWRSYIAQYFFQKSQLHVLFVAPYVEQYRNFHDYVQDFNKQLDIYQKVNHLLKWLSDTKNKQPNMVELYKAMYERGFLEEQDVHFIKAWIKTFENS